MRSADLVIHNGSIKTLDPALGTVEAALIRGQHVVAAGSADAVRAAAQPGYADLDLKGRTALPGLCDAHIHLLWTGRVANHVALDGTDTLEAALERVRAHAATLPPTAWVQGHGWDHTSWGRWPTAAELDAVVGGRPAVLTRKDLHSAWCSSAALARAGATAATPDPADGSFGRDAAGLTGMVFEGAMALITAAIVAPTPADDERALVRLMDAMLAQGITSAHAPEGPDCFSALGSLYGRGELRLRVLHHLRLSLLEPALALGLRSGTGDAWLRIGGLKIFSDGSLGSQTAHMLAPYAGADPNAPGPYGMPMLAPEELNELARRAVAGGISLTVHAIGDAANQLVLNAMEAAPRPGPAYRAPGAAAGMVHIPHRIEHAQVLAPEDIRRFGALGIIASIQPIHAIGDMVMAERLLGARCETAYAWRSLLETGAVLACGSDAPVESWNPWAGIHAAVTRQRRDGTPGGGWNAAERLSLDEALWGYTVGPALASGELALKGTLTPGKLADMIVVDRDLDAADPAELHAVAVDYTLVDGQVVQERQR